MIGAGDGKRSPINVVSRTKQAEPNGAAPNGTEELRLRVQQLSLREQIERGIPDQGGGAKRRCSQWN